MGKYDFKLAIIGSGAAGSEAAFLAAQLKVKTVIIEANLWGGAEINACGTLSRAMLDFAHLYARAKNGTKFGLSSASLKYNYPTVQNRWNTMVKRARSDRKKRLEDAGVTCMQGLAHLISPHEIAVGDKTICVEKILVASGTVPKTGDITGAQTVGCLAPESVLMLPRLPKTALVVGGGSTGCEIAQYLAEMGTKVLLVEMEERLLPREDVEVGAEMEKIFAQKNKIRALTSTKVVAVEQSGKNKRVFIAQNGKERTIQAETVVLATGRQSLIDLGLENAGVKLEDNRLKVNAELQTSCKNIFAAGGVLGGEASTEKAQYEAAVAMSNLIKGQKAIVNYSGFARTTHTSPRVVKIGLNETECQITKKRAKAMIIPIEETVAATVADEKFGFLKLIADKKGVILGATAVSPEAESFMQEIAIAIRHGLSVQELAGTPHIAGSWGEMLKIAAKDLAK